MLPALKRVSTADPITATGHNAIIDALKDLFQGQPSADVDRRVLMLAALLRNPERFVLVKITRVDLTEDDVSQATGAYLASQVKYDYVGFGKPEVKAESVTPVYGRPVRGDEARIRPAEIGMSAFIERDITGPGDIAVKFMLLPGSETIAFKPCA